MLPIVRDCHTSSSDFKIDTCYGCHERTPANMAEEHREQRVQDLARCARCHRTGKGDDAHREGAAGGDSRENRRPRSDDDGR
jgi:ribosomal protein L34E